MDDLELKVKDFLKLLLYKEKIDKELKELNKQIALKNNELFEIFTERNINKIMVNDVEFKPDVKQNFNLIDGHKWDEDERFQKWLDDIGESDLWRVKKTIPFNTRDKFLRDYYEDKKQLPDFIKVDDFGYIKFNKSQIKRMVNDE